MRDLLHDLLWGFIFQPNLNLPLPWGLLRMLHGCRLQSTKWYVCLILKRLNLSEPARPQPACVFPTARSLHFTPHNCNYLLEFLSLICCASSFYMSKIDPPHILVLLHHTHSSLQCHSGYQILTSACKLFQSARDHLSVQQVSSFLPVCITGNYRVEQNHQRRRERSLLLGCSSQATSTVFCWQLARNHCTLFWCMDK